MTWKRLIAKAHPCMSDSSQSWEPEARGTACSLERVFSRWLSWSKPLAASSSGFCFFLSAGLIWSESPLQLLLLALTGRGFRDFLNLF